MSDYKYVDIPKALIKGKGFTAYFSQLKREWWDRYNDTPQKDYEYLEEYHVAIHYTPVHYAPWGYLYLPDDRVWEIKVKSREDIKKVWYFLKNASLKDVKNVFGFEYGKGDIKKVEAGKIS